MDVNIEDDCDSAPLTSITIYSDEAALPPKDMDEAVLARTYSNPTTSDAEVNGWTATLWRFKQANKTCDAVDVACEATNGRFYVVRVCAQDAAGTWWTGGCLFGD